MATDGRPAGQACSRCHGGAGRWTDAADTGDRHRSEHGRSAQPVRGTGGAAVTCQTAAAADAVNASAAVVRRVRPAYLDVLGGVNRCTWHSQSRHAPATPVRQGFYHRPDGRVSSVLVERLGGHRRGAWAATNCRTELSPVALTLQRLTRRDSDQHAC
jgi:hypothetical protein